MKSKIVAGDDEVTMGYHFPDVIITGRGAAVYSWRNKFAGATMVLNFSTIGDDAMPWHPLNDHSFEALMILMKY
ncbi:MAG: hypothetical protein PUD15_00535 [Prevotella sp.]|nr:hypothetical protein [Prevotella sp.]